MTPAPFHAKQEQFDGGAYDQLPLKIHKDPKFIHCPPPPSSTGSSESLKNNRSREPQPPPRPLIIYTHSPKVIHTQPRDFMALVQKLTGYTRPKEDTQQPTQGNHGVDQDNESTSVVTEEHGSSVNDVSPVNSCFVDGGGVGVGVVPSHARYNHRGSGFDPYFNTAPVFQANPTTDFLCGSSHQLPFYSSDSMFLNRNSSLRVLKEYRDV